MTIIIKSDNGTLDTFDGVLSANSIEYFDMEFPFSSEWFTTVKFQDACHEDVKIQGIIIFSVC